MFKRKIRTIISLISLLLVSMSIGLITTKTLNAKADQNISLKVNAVFKEENSDSQPYQVNSWTGAFSSDVLSGITYNDFFKTAFGDAYVSPYTMYDELHIAFQYGNHVITPEQAIEKNKLIFKGYNINVEEYKANVDPVISAFPNTSVDYAKTKSEASQKVFPIADATANGTYTLPDFVIYLVSNDYKMTIKYVMPDGSSVADNRIVTGYVGEEPAAIDSPAAKVKGYEPDQKSVKVDFAKAGDYTITVHYNKPGSNTGSTPTADQASLTADKSATVVTGQSVNAATFNAKATDRDGKDIPVTVDTSKVNFKVAGTYPITLSAGNGKSVTATLTVKVATADLETVAQKKSAILAVKPIYLYQKPTFNKHQRLAKYVKASRGERPMFVVLGYAHSKSGLLRYRVKDVNHKSKTDGKTGYVTANSTFVTTAYYQKTVKRVKVLNKSGVNEYRKVNLTGKTKHLKKNQTVKVMGLEHHNLTTRFKLSNGHYITANKNLVMIVK